MPCDYTAIHQSVTAHRRPSLALQVPCPGGMEQAKARSEATGEHGGKKKKTVLTRAPETPLPLPVRVVSGHVPRRPPRIF